VWSQRARAKARNRKPPQTKHWLGGIRKSWKEQELSLSSALRTTTVSFTEDLLSHEQALNVVAGAVGLLRQPGQDKLELRPLRILVDAVQTYDSVLQMRECLNSAQGPFCPIETKSYRVPRARTLFSHAYVA